MYILQTKNKKQFVSYSHETLRYGLKFYPVSAHPKKFQYATENCSAAAEMAEKFSKFWREKIVVVESAMAEKNV